MLHTRHLLSLSGEDVVAFLQGLISTDARKLEQGEALYATLLTPQGKFLHDFFLIPWQGVVLLDCHTKSAEDIRRRLNIYKLRSRVVIGDAPEGLGVAAIWEDTMNFTLPDCVAAVDPRLPSMGLRIVGNAAAIESACTQRHIASGDYEAHRIAQGVPDGTHDMIFEKSFLLEWGIDQLHGVDYQKGCYVGQEVTARTHYRGQVRKAPYQVHAKDGLLPPPGTAIVCGEAGVGELRSSAGAQGIALLRLEEVEKSMAAGVTLRVGQQEITAKLPPWFTLPPEK